MEFLLGNPVILSMTVLVLLLVLAFPVGIIQARRKNKAVAARPQESSAGTRIDTPAEPPASQQRSSFMGSGFDLAILLFGILLLTVIVLSLVDAFS